MEGIVKCEGVRGHLQVRVLQVTELFQGVGVSQEKMGVELGEKATEKKVTAALSRRQIPDLLL